MSDVRTALITGASSGLGMEAAKALAAMGWNIIAHGRDPKRSAAAEAGIRAVAKGDVHWVNADLSLMADTARMADEVASLTPKIHVLLANAGGTRAEMVITPEGNEATFAGNHLGHFLLAQRLLPQLRVADGARVISVSSSGHAHCPALNWDDLNCEKQWDSGRVYCQAKLCNILFTRALAKREGANGITAIAMQPGVIASNFANHCTPSMKAYMESLDGLTPEDGAKPLVWMATAPGIANNAYFEKFDAYEPAAPARDDDAAARLWAESARRVALAGFA